MPVASSYPCPFDVVVIASSLGGVKALRSLLTDLPMSFPCPLLVVQHRAAVEQGRIDRLPEALGFKCALPVRLAQDGASLLPGRVYVAPTGWHLEVGPGPVARLTEAPRERFWRPSANVLFRSAAAHFGTRALGVVLTGRLDDGAEGAAAIRAAGGRVLVQDRASCEAYDMPRAAIQAGAADFVLPLERIPAALVALTMSPGTERLFGVGDRGRRLLAR